MTLFCIEKLSHHQIGE